MQFVRVRYFLQFIRSCLPRCWCCSTSSAVWFWPGSWSGERRCSNRPTMTRRNEKTINGAISCFPASTSGRSGYRFLSSGFSSSPPGSTSVTYRWKQRAMAKVLHNSPWSSPSFAMQENEDPKFLSRNHAVLCYWSHTYTNFEFITSLGVHEEEERLVMLLGLHVDVVRWCLCCLLSRS